MTEEATQPEDVQSVSADEHCRHCGHVKNAITEMANPDDWLCAACERWQDSMACPTCGSVVRISLMPDDLAPAVAKAKRK